MGLLDCLRKTLRAEGARGLYTGLHHSGGGSSFFSFFLSPEAELPNSFIYIGVKTAMGRGFVGTALFI